MRSIETNRRALVALVLVTALSSAARPETQEARPLRVLFVGNSYTYFQNLPAVLASLARGAGRALETRMVAPGGWRLRDHLEGEAPGVLAEGGWDVVVLQEQSTLGSNLYVDGQTRVGDDSVYRPAVERWAAAVTAAGARPLLYLTWARRHAPEDQATLDAAVHAAAAATGADVAPVGPAWALARARRPELELYIQDGSHPTPAGTYLAACTFYATLFDASPVGLAPRASGTPVDLDTEAERAGETAVLVDLDPADARVLQQAAWDALQAQKADRGPAPERPQGATLPSLPAGLALTPETLAGTWKGTLTFFPTGPTDVTLFLEAPTTGTRWNGFVAFAHHSADLQDGTRDLLDLPIEGNELDFTVPGMPFDLVVRFRAVRTADGTLEGQAEALRGSGAGALRLLGRWSLRRESD